MPSGNKLGKKKDQEEEKVVDVQQEKSLQQTEEKKVTSVEEPEWYKKLRDNYELLPVTMDFFKDTINELPTCEHLADINQKEKDASQEFTNVTQMEQSTNDYNKEMQESQGTDKKEAGEDLYTQCMSRIEECKHLYPELLIAIQGTKDRVSDKNLSELHENWRETKNVMDENLAEDKRVGGQPSEEHFITAAKAWNTYDRLLELKEPDITPEKGTDLDSLKAEVNQKKGTLDHYYKELDSAALTKYKERLLNEKDGVSKKKKDTIREKFRAVPATAPIILLIKNVKKINAGGIPEDVSAVDVLLKVNEKYEEVKGNVESFTDPVKTGIEFDEKLQVYKGKAPEVETVSVSEKVTGIISNIKDTAVFIYEIVNAVQDWEKMTDSNKTDKIQSLVSSGLSVAKSTMETAVLFLGEVPILGSVISLLGNAISFFDNGFKIYMSNKRLSSVREQKELLKTKMLKRRKKYAEDEDLKAQNLYHYVEGDKSNKAHIIKSGINSVKGKSAKSQRRDVDKTVTNKKLMEQTVTDKKTNKDAKKKYYKAKAAESLTQYDEMKEANRKNKNILRESIINLVQEGASLAGNIASFVPGIGSLIKTGVDLINVTASGGRKAFTYLHQKGKDVFGSERSTKNKNKLRNHFASDLMENLLSISGYVTESSGIDADAIEEDKLKLMDLRYSHTESILNGIGAYLPDLIGASNKESLMEAMSNAFAVNG